MQPQQKTSHKGFYAKSKSYNTQNYPYSTDETPPPHYNSYKQNNPYKHPKNKKYSNDNTNYQSGSELYPQSNRANTQPNENNPQSHQSYGYKDKWQHVINFSRFFFPLIFCIFRINIMMTNKAIFLQKTPTIIQETLVKIKIKARKNPIDNFILPEINMSMVKMPNLNPPTQKP